MARIVAAAAVFWLLPIAAAAQQALSSAALQTGLSSAALQMRMPSIFDPRDVFTARPATYAPTFEEPSRVHLRFHPCCGAFFGAPFFFPGFDPGVVLVPGYFPGFANAGSAGYFPGFANAVGSVKPSWARRSPLQQGPLAEWLGYLRLLVEPDTAQVYIDSFYVGTVAGVGRLVTLEPGPHRVELRAPEYDTEAVDVDIVPTETITFRAALQPSGSTAQPVAPAPGTPKTFYVIPRCYAGDRRPEPSALPPSCDISRLRAIPPGVK
jgi:hypothetical protein